MSIPLDKLYHYIESVAKSVCKDNIIIYRFFPHGSKNLNDLTLLKSIGWRDVASVELYGHDQEPLDYDHCKNTFLNSSFPNKEMFIDNNVPILNKILRKGGGIFDSCILLHSELNSAEVKKYEANNFVPVYYWCHGLIALDWFRFARYETPNKNVSKTFLMYNRAWSGTREYRLKLVDLLIENNLTNDCKSYFNPIEPQDNIHYHSHVFKNNSLRPTNNLENYFDLTTAASSSSADYELTDYNSTDFEVVLETLFDDPRIQLTEKILRPIALGQPFILASTKGSLEYLRSYGFKTFNSIIDESYDLIEDPVKRLEAIVNTMKQITLWTADERDRKLKEANKITEYNRNLFFSKQFFNQIVDELKTNLLTAYIKIKSTNTGTFFINRRKELYRCTGMHKFLLEKLSRQDMVKILKCAREYYKYRLDKK